MKRICLLATFCFGISSVACEEFLDLFNGTQLPESEEPNGDDLVETVVIEDDFEFSDLDNWKFVRSESRFGKGNPPDESGVTVADGVLTLHVDETDYAPYMHGIAIPLEAGDVLTVRRKVRISPANDKFLGQLNIRGTDRPGLHSDFVDDASLVNIHYLDYDWDGSTHAGSWDAFVLNESLWEGEERSPRELSNMVDSIWNEWFEEELIYDTGTRLTTYSINGQVVMEADALNELSTDYVKLLISPYGWYTGHTTSMDWIEVTRLHAPNGAGDDDPIDEPDNGEPDDPEKYACTAPGGLSILMEPPEVEFIDPETDRTLYLHRFRMISPGEAYATRGNANEFDLWRTVDGGHSFEIVNTVDARNSGNNAGLWFHAYPDEMWYTTRFSGFGYSGTAGVSHDGGHTWNEIEEVVHELYGGSRFPINGLGRVQNRDLHILSMGEDRDSLAISHDGGQTWERHDQPDNVRGLRLHSTDDFLLAGGLTSNMTSDWELFRFNFETYTFEGIRNHLPDDFSGRFTGSSRIDVSPATDTFTLTDPEGHDTPERSALYTTDGGESFHTLYWQREVCEDGFELRRAIALDENVGFIAERGSRNTRIRATCDGGESWHTIVEHSNGPTHIYNLVADMSGHVHAIWTGAAGSTAIRQLTEE